MKRDWLSLVMALTLPTLALLRPAAISAAEPAVDPTDAACLEKILRFYKGPTLDKAHFPGGFAAQLTVERGGAVKWFHPLKDEKQQNALEQEATAALRDAALAASPLPVNPSWTGQRWQGRMAVDDKLNYWTVDFPGYITCLAGAEAEKRWPPPFHTVSAALQKQVVDKFSFTSKTRGLTAAAWCFIQPDGTIDSITPVRALRAKPKYKANFAEIARAQKALVKALQSSSPLKLASPGKYPHPRGLVVLYENDRQPQLQFEDYFYERCPDRVLDARP